MDYRYWILAAILVLTPMTGVARDLIGTRPDGGVLVLHYHAETAVTPDTDYCDHLDLFSIEDAMTSVPADGLPHLIAVYGVFPDSTSITGANFGLEYTDQVEVLEWGPCNRSGLEIPMNSWPEDETGTAFSVLPEAQGPVIPLYWFVVRATGPGHLGARPHPFHRLGGAFGSGSAAPVLGAVVDYGSVGFGEGGKTPVPGGSHPRAACCLDRCYTLSSYECDYYGGLFLGNDSTCEVQPCGEDARVGACCVDGYCQVGTRVDCVKQGGTFLGEGSSCDTSDCSSVVDPGGNQK